MIVRVSVVTTALVLMAGVGLAAAGEHGRGHGGEHAGSTARPAAAGADGRPLTLDEALRLCRQRNKSLVADRARVAQAQTNIAGAWARILPTVAAQGRYTRNYAEFGFPSTMPGLPPLLFQPVNQLDGMVSFNAPLIVPAAYPGLQAVKAGVAAAEANFEVTETTLLYGVAQAFYAAAIADDVLVARDSNIEVARATLTNAKSRFAAGTVTKVDVDRAELALVRAEQMRREVMHGRQQAYRTLGTLIQIEGPFKVVPPEGLPPAAAPGETDNLENVLHLRPEFRALELSAKAGDLEAKADGWRWSPSISAFGNARKFNYDNFRRDRYSWALGLQLDWVIYDGGGRDAQRRMARAQSDEAVARSEALRDAIRDDLANARSLLDTKRQALQAASRSVALARETLDLVRAQYEAGTVTQVDLLQAQDGLAASEEAVAQARFDVATADLTLRRSAGTFPPK